MWSSRLCEFNKNQKTSIVRFQILTLMCSRHGWFFFVNREPWCRCLKAFIDIIDVLHTFVLQPFAERLGSLLCIDRDAIFPGGASAQYAVEFHTRFRS